MKYIVFLVIVLLAACKQYKAPETSRVLGTEEKCYVIGDFPGNKKRASISDTVYSISPNRDYIKPADRYFIVFYNGFTNDKNDVYGWKPVTVTNGYGLDPQQFVDAIYKEYKKKNNLRDITITGFNEVNKRDFDRWNKKTY